MNAVNTLSRLHASPTASGSTCVPERTHRASSTKKRMAFTTNVQTISQSAREGAGACV